MDPAEIEAVRRALAAQGQRIGHQDQQLQEVQGAFQSLNLTMSHLSAQMEEILTGLPVRTAGLAVEGAAAATSSSATHTSREVQISSPRHYGGDINTCRSFLMQCDNVFCHQVTMYAADSARVAFVSNLLTGRALEWANALWENQSSVLNDYSCFARSLRQVFDHPTRNADTVGRLLKIRQGSRSVAEYSVEFRILAIDSGWNDRALQHAFRQGLSDVLKDELALRDEPPDLEELIRFASRLDSRLQERRRGRNYTSQQPSRWESRSPDQSLETRGWERRVSVPLDRAPSAGREVPMQVDRSRVSAAERQRRIRDGACHYCGKVGHLVAQCRERPKDGAHQ